MTEPTKLRTGGPDLGVHTDYRPNLVFVRRRDLGTPQLARPARLAHPFRSRACLARGVGDVDIAAKPDNVAKTQIAEELEQFMVAKAAVGEDRDGTFAWHQLLQSEQARVLEVVALIRKFVFPDSQPQQWRRPAMAGHQMSASVACPSRS